MRRDLNTCSSQSAMHHRVPVRVFFRRSSEHHSRNDSSSSTSWSHDSHVFFSQSYLGRTRNFSEGSVQQHPSPCSFRKRVGRKRKKCRAGPTSSTFSCATVYSRGNRTPESEKKQTSVYLIKRKMKKKFWYTYQVRIISPFVVALAAGVNSNPSSRERLLRTANPRQHPNSCIHG